MAKWFCSIKPAGDPLALIVETEDDAAALATLVVDAEMAFGARQFAHIMLRRLARVPGELGDDPTLIVHQTGPDAIADYALRWVGSDAGEVPGRRLQFRKRGYQTWVDWNPANTEAR